MPCSLDPEGNIAPALQAAREQLQRSQLEVCVSLCQEGDTCDHSYGLYKDKLDQKLLHRPKPEELVKCGILLRE
jgi:RPEL repeat